MKCFDFNFKSCAVVAAAAWGLFAASPLRADQDVWKAAASGSWHVGSRWEDGSTPSSIFDSATFNKAGAHTVLFDPAPAPIGRLTLTSGADVTFASSSPLAPRSLSLFEATAGSGRLLVDNGAALTLGVTNSPLHLTAQDDLLLQNGTLNARFGSRVQSKTLLVGIGGTAGTLDVNSGGSVTADDVRIGDNSGSNGTLTVTGTGSSLLILNDLNMSSSGTATLRIMTGGGVSVSQNTSLGANDALHLEGGRLFARSINALGQIPFFWTSGTFSFGQFSDDLTIPSGGVLATAGFFPNHVSGNLTSLPGATTQIFIRPFATADQIQADGHVVLDGGNLELSLAEGFTPAPGERAIMTTGLGIFGSFANVANGQRLATSDRRGSFLVNYGPGSPFDPKSVFISAYLPATPGDFDVDGDVDGRDFLFWQRGESPTPGSAADLAAWRVNFGAGASAAASAAIPEPAAAWLAMAAIAVACACRKC
jgi:T5SS/PEP-CTERM-associated repeat protein